MKLLNVILQESQLGDKLAMGIYKAIDNIDPNLNYKDFASAVATVIKNEYGTHNIEPFMKELHSHLGIQEDTNEGFQTMDRKEIAAFLQNKYPKLKFDVNTYADRIDVIGGEQDKLNFGDKYHGQTFGDYEVFHIDDEDRGEIVRLVRSNSIHRG
jgi:hypothetical protein